MFFKKTERKRSLLALLCAMFALSGAGMVVGCENTGEGIEDDVEEAGDEVEDVTDG